MGRNLVNFPNKTGKPNNKPRTWEFFQLFMVSHWGQKVGHALNIIKSMYFPRMGKSSICFRKGINPAVLGVTPPGW